MKQVKHNYSDCPPKGISILSYCYEEVFAEKLRALVQRLRPRDLYDVIYLYRHNEKNPNRDIIYSTLEKKCHLRGVEIPTMEVIETHVNRSLLASEWENQLKHQVSELQNIQSFLSELPQVLDWIVDKLKN